MIWNFNPFKYQSGGSTLYHTMVTPDSSENYEKICIQRFVIWLIPFLTKLNFNIHKERFKKALAPIALNAILYTIFFCNFSS